MAERLPTLGESPWKAIMDGFLLVSHNADGTLRTSLTPAFTSMVVGTPSGSTIALNVLSAATAAPAIVGRSTGYYGGLFFNVTDAGTDLANANMIGLVGQSVYSNAFYAQQGAVSGDGSTLQRDNIYAAAYVTRVVAALNGFNYTAPLLRIDDTTTSTGGMIDVKRVGTTLFAMANTGAIVATAQSGIGLIINRGIQFNAAVNATVAGPSLAVSSNSLRVSSGTTGVAFISQDQGTQIGDITNAGFWGLSIAAASATTFVNTPAGTTAASSLRIPQGAAPTSPVNGDVWMTSAGLFYRANGATVGPVS